MRFLQREKKKKHSKNTEHYQASCLAGHVLHVPSIIRDRSYALQIPTLKLNQALNGANVALKRTCMLYTLLSLAQTKNGSTKHVSVQRFGQLPRPPAPQWEHYQSALSSLLSSRQKVAPTYRKLRGISAKKLLLRLCFFPLRDLCTVSRRPTTLSPIR